MSDVKPTLRQLQCWMQNVITHPLGVDAGLEAESEGEHLHVPAADVEAVIQRSRRLTAAQRLEVYANAYYSRLLECMRESFPALTAAVGAPVFDEFAFGYLQAHPSSSYTLNRLADHFVEYLRATRPESASDEPETSEASDARSSSADWPDFVIDLARLERTFEEVFDGPGLENERPLTADDLRGLSPDAWAETRLIAAPCLRLLELKFPVNAYYSAWRRGQSPGIPAPRPSHLAVSRREYVVRRYELTAPEHRLLSELAAGETVGAAIESAAEGFDDLERFGQTLGAWFQKWGAAQLFWRVERA